MFVDAGYMRPENDPFDIEESAVTIDRTKQLGKGNYGVVYQGALKTDAQAAKGTNGTKATKRRKGRVVAVKMLPEDRPIELTERQEFWEEIKFLRELQVNHRACAASRLSTVDCRLQTHLVRSKGFARFFCGRNAPCLRVAVDTNPFAST